MRSRQIGKPSLALLLAVGLVLKILVSADSFAYAAETTPASRKQDFPKALDIAVSAIKQDYPNSLDIERIALVETPLDSSPEEPASSQFSLVGFFRDFFSGQSASVLDSLYDVFNPSTSSQEPVVVKEAVPVPSLPKQSPTKTSSELFTLPKSAPPQKTSSGSVGSTSIIGSDSITRTEVDERINSINNTLSLQIAALSSAGKSQPASAYASIGTASITSIPVYSFANLNASSNQNLTGNSFSSATISSSTITGSALGATTLTASGATTLSSTLALTGAATFSSTLSAGTTTIPNLIVTGSATSTFAYDVSVAGRLNSAQLTISGLGAGWLSSNSSGNVSASSSPTINYLTATSTTATSSFAYDLSVLGRLKVSQSGTAAVIVGDTTGNARGASALDTQSSRSAITQVANGVCAVAYGVNNTASGNNSTSVGSNSIASGNCAGAFGFSNTASGYSSAAFGFGNTACDRATALGYSNGACGLNSLSVGGYNCSVGACSFAAGYCNVACGNDSLALGKSNSATCNGVSVGFGNTTCLDCTGAFGHSNNVQAGCAYAFGAFITNNVANSIEIGVSDTNKLRINNEGGVDFITSTGCGFCVNGMAIGGGGVNGLNPIEVGSGNTASSCCSSGLGYTNLACACAAAAVGTCNSASGYMSSAFGVCNIASASMSSAVGVRNIACGDNSTASGYCSIAGACAASAFGYKNSAVGCSTALGFCNIASDINASAIGYANCACSPGSVAFGSAACAGACNALVFGSSIANATADSVMIGNAFVNFCMLSDCTISVSNCGCMDSSGAWTVPSDRNLKENFTTLDSQAVLQKIASLPITQWNYIKEDDSVTHIGPMAQDFYAAFQTGGSDKRISTIDPAGVALVGIQALNKNFTDLSASTTFSLESLRLRLDQIEAVSSTGGGGSSLFQTLQAFGASIVDGVVHFGEVVVDKMFASHLVIKNSADISKTGYTIYDRATLQPICVYFENGVQKTSSGECEEESAPAPEQIIQGAGNPTPDAPASGSDAPTTPEGSEEPVPQSSGGESVETETPPSQGEPESSPVITETPPVEPPPAETPLPVEPSSTDTPPVETPPPVEPPPTIE